MSLPRFLDRVVDAAVPALGGLDRRAVVAKLESVAVGLVAGARADDVASRAGFLLAANLAARLYPRIVLEGPQGICKEAEAEIRRINPQVEIGGEDVTARLLCEAGPEDQNSVSVQARGWNVHVDEPELVPGPAATPAALLACVLGASELFRIVFAAELGEKGRTAPQPGRFNMVTLGQPREDLPIELSRDLGEIRLVGAGAIGQAAAVTLAHAGTTGTLLAVDPEVISLSNLQRYVLSREADVGAVKVNLLLERLSGSPLNVVPIQAPWHAELVDRQCPTLVALDSSEDRIALQASLPGPIYNAWTQPADVGWSRHELFGQEACLACLYWPTQRIPSLYEEIARAFKQHPLRVLAYLTLQGIPVGVPLPVGGIPAVPGLEAPPDAEHWLGQALIDDIAAQAGIEVAELSSWRERPLTELYQDGICAGALLPLGIGQAPREVLVPLAHQSAFSGVMLATELLVAREPALRSARPTSVEGRFDVLGGLPQVLARPRVRSEHCLCRDDVFDAVYLERLATEPTSPGRSDTEAAIGESAGRT